MHHSCAFYFTGKSKTASLSWRAYNPLGGREGPANNYFQMKCLQSHVSGARHRSSEILGCERIINKKNHLFVLLDPQNLRDFYFFFFFLLKFSAVEEENRELFISLVDELHVYREV